MGINEESQIKFSKTAKAKYTDRAIVDLVTRIARDPIRKLGPQDRFIGPMRIALSAGIRPKAIALGAAAALYLSLIHISGQLCACRIYDNCIPMAG